MDELTTTEREELHADLLTLKAELEAAIADSREGSRPVDLDLPIGRVSRVDAMQQQGMLAANRRAAQARLRQVASALSRFEDDEYGDCAGCGEPVGFRRLKARPEAPFCLACQSRRERARD
ncbi:MAG: TraR/DksA family transcriptional regulator [Myxococcota bacterium]